MRDTYIDRLRGFAMLLVVLGHTMQGVTVGAQSTLIYNVIWTLQMPLFVLISGYITRYSKPVCTLKELLAFIIKRTMSYIYPWLIWTFFIKGYLYGDVYLLDLKYLFWNMDSGYWFLVTIWMINIIYGIAGYISNKINSKKYSCFCTCFFSICMIGVIALLGSIIGLEFLGIKYTIYYMAFFLIGSFYGWFEKFLEKSQRIIGLLSVLALFIWIICLSKINVYELPDSGVWMVVRVIISLLGCFAVFKIFKSVSENINKNISDFFLWSGKHSLEIYLIHYLFLNIFVMLDVPDIVTWQGKILVIINYCVTLMCVYVILKLISMNDVLSRVLFWKKGISNWSGKE